METTLKSKSNKSPFQGWIENETHRAQWQQGTWELFEKHEGAFVRCALVAGEKTDSLEQIVSAARDAEFPAPAEEPDEDMIDRLR